MLKIISIRSKFIVSRLKIADYILEVENIISNTNIDVENKYSLLQRLEKKHTDIPFVKWYIMENFFKYYKQYYIDKSKEGEYMKTYIIESNFGYKIGKTMKKVEERHSQFKHMLGTESKILHIINSDVENKLHRKFKDKRIKGEWFDLSIEDINYIKSLN